MPLSAINADNLYETTRQALRTSWRHDDEESSTLS
jgi:hypothetical protein